MSTKKDGKERAEYHFRKLSKTTNLEHLRKITQKGYLNPKMPKEIRPYNEGYTDRMCVLLKVKRSDYKLPWEK